MIRDEAKKILMSIQAAYPNYKPPDKSVAVDTWLCMLEAYTYEHINAALKAYILSDTSGFPPSIGQIIEKLNLIFSPPELNEMEAWGIVKKAISRSTYYAEEEFEKLPDILKRSIASPGQLREWATQENIDGRTLGVIQSNFMRTFRAVKEQHKEMKKLSQDLMGAIQEKEHNKIESKITGLVEEIYES